jgi:hypothetical protein
MDWGIVVGELAVFPSYSAIAYGTLHELHLNPSPNAIAYNTLRDRTLFSQKTSHLLFIVGEAFCSSNGCSADRAFKKE